MTNETRSPEEIEREIEAQRSNLSSNLEDLQDRFSIDGFVRQIGEQFREHGGDMSRSISNQIKANPIPLALTGIGLAWMMFGNQQRSPAPSDDHDDRYSPAERDYRNTRMQQGRPYVAPTYPATAYRSAPSWSEPETDDSRSLSDRYAAGAAAARDSVARGGTAVKDAVSSGAGAAADGARSTGAAVSSAASSATSSVKGAASQGASAVASGAKSAGAAVSNAASSAASSVADAAAAARQGIAAAGARIAEGTEHLSEEGRRRVIIARQKAIDLRHRAASSAREGADAVSDLYDHQPLVFGALAVAVGAAMGGALPRTRTEDDLMGQHSDDLFHEAERIFEDEKAKALRVAESVKKEVKDIAAETKADLNSGAPGNKTAVEAVGDKAKSAANRVADKAKSTAQREGLGDPKT